MARAIVFFCTGNQNKLMEVQRLMDGVPVEFRSLDVDLPELQGSPADIAKAKCEAALQHRRQTTDSNRSGVPQFIFTEDTALCFNALGGLPGPYVKWFLNNLGAEGLPKLLAGFEDKTAYALTSLCIADQEGHLHLFEGRCDGSVVEPRGKKTFGWDCIFEEASSGKTFGEMTTEEKAGVSHRGLAIKQLKEFLLKVTA
ncbi:inosine triphosphate pyrophosphatase [Cyclospora cayetanensis]|uniref:Inosine triphosphate pyrophosphatase n=1 Tax=Cyclospora cayetanensis TaxID=88456 RepID=A0A6P6S0Y4_9EIME|nr:inosine triphosphate pyrophosphatase [Cyclospora cayetanensis]